MNKKICIAIDAMGGENAPYKNIKGIDLFYKKNKDNKDFFFNIFGNEEKVSSELKNCSIPSEYYKINHTSSVVSDNETPLTAVKTSKNSSMWNSVYSQVKSESDISLSAGNTGVLLVISRMILKTINGVSKPALAGLWPNYKGMNIVLDLGANIECDEKNLIEFSEMGAALHKSLFPNEKTKVSLLNVGSEEIKGTETIKKAFIKLKEISNNEDFEFKGYIEGNKIPDGDSNVIVTDGFTGNIALKTAEGTANFIVKELKKAMTGSIIGKISSILNYYNLKKFKNRLDPRLYNGAIFLGLDSPVVKSHGGTDFIGFSNSLDVCNKIVQGNLIEKIKHNI